MRKPIFAANWKMHHGPRDARAFVERFLEVFPRPNDRTVVLFPPHVSLETVSSALRERSEIRTGAQNISTEPSGAFTGECSAAMARDAGAAFVLVGHSERRHVFGETSEQTATKCVRGFEAGLNPVLCVGETLAQREAGSTEITVIEQLRVGASKLTPAQVSQLVVAYEPVWAIGTGRTATPADAATVHRVIRATLLEIAGDTADRVPILYGGSVNEGNAAGLLAADGVGGLLVGGASLEPVGWARLCQS